jgi:hypothetical protein
MAGTTERVAELKDRAGETAAEIAHGTGGVASALGRGFAAGLAGTAAMTAVQKIEMEISNREASSAPAEAVEKVLDVEPETETEAAEERLAQLTHWAYGGAWGAFRGLLDVAGLRGPAATAVHFAAVWGGAMVMLPRLGLAPPVKEWGGKQIAKDALFHAVYAVAAGQAYDRMSANGRNGAR